MKKILTGLLLTMLIFANCRRKSSHSIIASNQDDTTETPPAPPGSTQDSTNTTDTTTVKTYHKFTFQPQKQNLETGNIGIIYKENNADNLLFYVNICGGNSVYGVTFDLDYDSSKIILKKVTEGSFLNKDGAQTNFLFNNSNVGISRAGPVPGVSGDGTVCIIELEVKTIFDSLNIGFRHQSATNKELIEVLPVSNWFGGILSYK